MKKEYDLSILVAGIRTTNWKGLYMSLLLACKRYKWELVLVSPFDLPEELKEFDNIQLIKDYGSVPRCIQKGVQYVKSDLFFITVDDGYMEINSLDLAMDLFKEKCTGPFDIVSVKYQENNNQAPDVYWNVNHHVGLQKRGIPQHFKIAMQPLMKKELFINIGGLDCMTFEYLDKPLHDLIFRIQFHGGQVHLTSHYGCNSTWLMGTQGDHGPIHNAEFEHEIPLFDVMYSVPDILSRRDVPYDNWQQAPAVWKRRFSKGVPKTYEDLCVQEGYDFKGLVYDLESYAIKMGLKNSSEKLSIQKVQEEQIKNR